MWQSMLKELYIVLNVSESRGQKTLHWPNPALPWFWYLVECSHSHSFTIVCGCFLVIKAELSSWDREHMALEASNIYYWTLHRKKKCWAWVKEFIHKRKAKRNWHGIVDTLRAFKPLSNLDRKCISKWWVAATWRHIGEEVRLVVWKPLR